MASARMVPVDDEVLLPCATLNKLIREILGPKVPVSGKSRGIIHACCLEFLHLLTSEANEISSQQGKVSICPDHIFQALDRLGFGDFRAEAEAVLREFKSSCKREKFSKRLEDMDIPEEELLRQQQELFAKAKEELEHAERKHFDWKQQRFVTEMASMMQQDENKQNENEQDNYS